MAQAAVDDDPALFARGRQSRRHRQRSGSRRAREPFRLCIPRERNAGGTIC